jgi:hypothetical protein
VAIGDALGAKSDLQDKEAAVKGYMATSNAQFARYSDLLCNPDKLGAERDPQLAVSRDSAIGILVSDLPPGSGVEAKDVTQMCQSREAVGANTVFIFVNLSTWLFLVGVFMVSAVHVKRSRFWRYGERS